MRALALSFAALSASACMSNPDEILPIHGSVTSSSQVTGQAVRLRRKFQPYGPLGLCVADEETPVLKEATVQADGGYRLQLFRAEGQPLGVFGQFCFRVETTFDSGSRAWSELNSLLLDNPLAPFPDWPSAVFVDGGLLVFEPVIPLPRDYDRSLLENPSEPQLDHAFEFVTDSGTAWRGSDSTSEFRDGGISYRRRPMHLDALRLGDFSGTVRLNATFYDPSLRTQYGFYDNSLPAVQLRPPHDPFVQGVSVPLSRGLPCPPFELPCPFTDRSLDRVDGGLAQGLRLDLATPAVVRALVLRDVGVFGAEVQVEQTLEDGGLWSITDTNVPGYVPDYSMPFAILHLEDGGRLGVTNSYRAIELDAGAPARSVTVKFPHGLVFLRELSLF